MKLNIGQFKGVFDKYKYLLLVIAVGAILLLWPQKKSTGTPQATAQSPPAITAEALESKLVNALEQMEGVGRANVVLTMKNDGETIYQTDTTNKVQQERENGETTGYHSETTDKTLTVSSGSSIQEPVVKQQSSPEYLGALIICDGGDNQSIVLQIVNAVTALTGISSDHITVVKMKS